MRRAVTLLAIACAGVAAGCGGDDGGGDDEQVRDVVRDYLTGLAAGNGDRACAQLTEEARKELVSEVTAAFPDPPELSCEEAVVDLSQDIAPIDKRKFLNPEVTKVSVDGDRATVTVKGLDGPTTLARDGDDWRIARRAGQA